MHFFVIKMKEHSSSCEIEYFVETHSLQPVCDTPIARITGCVSSSLRIEVGDPPCNYIPGSVVAIRVNRVMLVSLCAETIKPVSDHYIPLATQERLPRT